MIFFRNFLYLFLILFVSSTGMAQVKGEKAFNPKEHIIRTDSLSSDSDSTEIIVQKEKFTRRLFGKYPRPKTALTLSLILPGAGQIYNKKYWKVPIVYGTMGYFIWKISENKSDYEKFRDAYSIRVDGKEETVDQYVNIYSTSGLKQVRDLKKKNLESNYFILVLSYVLNGLDAYVDAHLLDFDVSDDLSLSIDPSVHNMAYQGINSTNLGLRVALNF